MKTPILAAAFIAAALAGGAQAAGTDNRWQAAPVPLIGIPGATVRQSAPALQVAQASDAAFRVNQLEEQVRLLNGQVEELNFQILQMQETLRRMQEDNEYRFQDLEEKSGSLGTGSNRLGKLQPSERNNEAQASGGDEIARVIDSQDATDDIGTTPGVTADGVEIYDGGGDAAGSSGLEAGSLGSITFDADGNIIDTNVGAPIDLTSRVGQNGIRQPGAQSGLEQTAPTELAALSLPDDPEQLYQLGYGYIQAGEYGQAEQAFGAFAERFPDNERLPEARFWHGESHYAQGNYEQAARIFLDTHRNYPESRLGPQTLLKLAASLAGMDQRELACATYGEVPIKYPQMTNAVRANLESGRRAARCSTN